MKEVLLTPFSWIYLLAITVRHWLFDIGVKRSIRPDIATICVGNITVGGTGKSPMCEMLVEQLSKRNKKVAILSRGYGRKSKGYIEVETNSSYKRVGDEPLQIKQSHPQALVVVCEKRVEGIARIGAEHPDVEVIIMDDGFQHRYVTPWLNIILIDATRPITEDKMLPAGSLRDIPKRLEKADMIVVTKCQSKEALQRATEGLQIGASQRVFATEIVNREPIALFPETEGTEGTEETEGVEGAPFVKKGHAAQVIAVAGIGNPTPFLEMIEGRYELVERLIYRDHHSYSEADIADMAQALERNPTAMLLMTQKDSVKIRTMPKIPAIVRKRAYYSPIEMQFIEGSKEQLMQRIEQAIESK